MPPPLPACRLTWAPGAEVRADQSCHRGSQAVPHNHQVPAPAVQPAILQHALVVGCRQVGLPLLTCLGLLLAGAAPNAAAGSGARSTTLFACPAGAQASGGARRRRPNVCSQLLAAPLALQPASS